jgi:circadian clock protein KaiC
MTEPALRPDRLSSSIPGLELITDGGLPRGRLTVVTGTAGSGKTVFATQFLASGVAQGEPAVFVTLEEQPDNIRSNVASFGWDLAGWEAEGLWAFVDATADHRTDTHFSGGGYDLSALISRVAGAVERMGARRVAIDSIGALLTQLDATAPARAAIFRLAARLQDLGVTTVITGERPDDYGPVGRFDFEEYVGDNVVILRNALDGEKRRRTIEVLKMRGASHTRGEHLFTIGTRRGITVVPVSVVTEDQPSSSRRTTSGVAALDEMCRGGWYERSLALVAGATGTGKSLMACHFAVGGAQAGERAVLHSFEESREQLLRNAASWGLPLAQLEEQGVLRVVAASPESSSLEEHLQGIKEVIDEFRPRRVAIDSLTALQRVATVRSFREYVLGLSFHIKHHAGLGLLTLTSGQFLSDERASHDLHVSTVSDTIVLLHYVASGPALRRGIAVLKMRGSDHDKAVREFTIGSHGMEVGDPFPTVSSILRP